MTAPTSPSHLSPMKQAGGQKRPGLVGPKCLSRSGVSFPSCNVQHLPNTLTSPITVPLNLMLTLQKIMRLKPEHDSLASSFLGDILLFPLSSPEEANLSS